MGWINRRRKIRERSLDDIKQMCRILFIDDRSFPVIDILKSSGWLDTKRIKDVESLDQSELKEAHILFVDIQGVGKKLKFHNEGLGLIVALKKKYPTKKIIAYSAEDQGKVQAFSEGINMADSRLSKDADPYQFQFLVEKYAQEAFSLTETVERIKLILIKELGQSINSELIVKKLEKIYFRNNYSSGTISKYFNLQNASNLAQIVQLFFTGSAS
jgi:hypothetical protein